MNYIFIIYSFVVLDVSIFLCKFVRSKFTSRIIFFERYCTM